jgi:hypothetical protein
VWKARGEPPKRLGAHQAKPKHLHFLLDASASMARGDAMDGRLRRMAATAALLMEALHGFEHKFVYSLTAHSGSTAELPLLEAGSPPATSDERARVVGSLFSHASSAASGQRSRSLERGGVSKPSAACHHLPNMAGDHSMEAARRAIEAAAAVDADDRYVFLLSDANLGRYDVSPDALGAVLRSDPHVRAYAIFVAEPQAAKWLAEQLPFGRGFAVHEVARLPAVMREIFTHAAISDET